MHRKRTDKEFIHRPFVAIAKLLDNCSCLGALLLSESGLYLIGEYEQFQRVVAGSLHPIGAILRGKRIFVAQSFLTGII